MTYHDPHEEDLIYDIKEKTSVSTFVELRRECSPDEYFNICHRLSSTEGILFDSLRSILWKDMVLGLEATPTVPYLADTLISHTKLENKDHHISLHNPAHACNSSRQSDRSNERSVGSAGCRKGVLVKPSARSISMPSISAVPRGERYSTLRRRSNSEIVKSPKTVRNGSTSLYPANDDKMTLPFSHFPSNCQIRVLEADIQRSLWLFYPQEEERNRMRSNLKKIILRVLANNPDRYYYQGLHELIGFVMYVLSPILSSEELVSICEGMLRTRWCTFSEKKLQHSEALLYAMHAVIAEKAPSLAMALEKCGVGPESHYAVSWIITWYVHSLRDLKVLARLFDYFITDEDGMAVIFFTSAFVISQQGRILNWIDEASAEMLSSGFDETDDITAMAKIYSQMTKMPSEVLDFMSIDELNKLIKQATQLRTNFLNAMHRERDNFINGKVRKLGFLANQRTRNAALRLLWYLLPREWRNPVIKRSLFQVMLVAGIVVFMTTALFCRSRLIESTIPL
ncbi:unnamed protein product [Phytomonas sp. Hart1]|nr:unnamed protein product [Phytomonas sp. Hart1]|eukprot:CCW66369.1 unnamed protein product [Phytomonas sp. isolate Hart1]